MLSVLLLMSVNSATSQYYIQFETPTFPASYYDVGPNNSNSDYDPSSYLDFYTYEAERIVPDGRLSCYVCGEEDQAGCSSQDLNPDFIQTCSKESSYCEVSAVHETVDEALTVHFLRSCAVYERLPGCATVLVNRTLLGEVALLSREEADSPLAPSVDEIVNYTVCSSYCTSDGCNSGDPQIQSADDDQQNHGKNCFVCASSVPPPSNVTTRDNDTYAGYVDAQNGDDVTVSPDFPADPVPVPVAPTDRCRNITWATMKFLTSCGPGYDHCALATRFYYDYNSEYVGNRVARACARSARPWHCTGNITRDGGALSRQHESFLDQGAEAEPDEQFPPRHWFGDVAQYQECSHYCDESDGCNGLLTLFPDLDSFTQAPTGRQHSPVPPYAVNDTLVGNRTFQLCYQCRSLFDADCGLDRVGLAHLRPCPYDSYCVTETGYEFGRMAVARHCTPKHRYVEVDASPRPASPYDPPAAAQRRIAGILNNTIRHGCYNESYDVQFNETYNQSAVLTGEELGELFETKYYDFYDYLTSLEDSYGYEAQADRTVGEWERNSTELRTTNSVPRCVFLCETEGCNGAVTSLATLLAKADVIDHGAESFQPVDDEEVQAWLDSTTTTTNYTEEDFERWKEEIRLNETRFKDFKFEDFDSTAFDAFAAQDVNSSSPSQDLYYQPDDYLEFVLEFLAHPTHPPTVAPPQTPFRPLALDNPAEQEERTPHFCVVCSSANPMQVDCARLEKRNRVRYAQPTVEPTTTPPTTTTTAAPQTSNQTANGTYYDYIYSQLVRDIVDYNVRETVAETHQYVTECPRGYDACGVIFSTAFGVEMAARSCVMTYENDVRGDVISRSGTCRDVPGSRGDVECVVACDESMCNADYLQRGPSEDPPQRDDVEAEVDDDDYVVSTDYESEMFVGDQELPHLSDKVQNRRCFVCSTLRGESCSAPSDSQLQWCDHRRQSCYLLHGLLLGRQHVVRGCTHEKSAVRCNEKEQRCRLTCSTDRCNNFQPSSGFINLQPESRQQPKSRQQTQDSGSSVKCYMCSSAISRTCLRDHVESEHEPEPCAEGFKYCRVAVGSFGGSLVIERSCARDKEDEGCDAGSSYCFEYCDTDGCNFMDIRELAKLRFEKSRLGEESETQSGSSRDLPVPAHLLVIPLSLALGFLSRDPTFLSQ